jgi:type II secretory pathway pseudopilin PulG
MEAFMKNKFMIPVISVILVIIAIASAIISIYVAKHKEIQLDETDLTLSDITVNGDQMKVTITAANSLGMRITNNTYTYENGKLKFKLYGSKQLEIGKPLTDNQVVSLVITAPGDIEEVYFVTVNDKGEEKEHSKSFKRGKF